MTFKGDLKEIGLTDLFQTLAANRKSGNLTIDPEGEGKPWTVAFLNGLLVAIDREGGLALEPADVLISWDMVAEKDGNEVLRRWRRAKKKTLGRILVDQKLLSRADYCNLVFRLMEEEALLILSQDKAFYSFSECRPELQDFDPEQVWAEPQINTGPLLLEAARRQDEWVRIRRNVAGDNELFIALEPEDGSVPEDDLQNQVFQALDGLADVTELLGRLPLTRFELANGLSSLVESGWARAATDQELADIAQTYFDNGDNEAGISCLQCALERHAHDTTMRIMLATALEDMGRQRDAARELALAAQELEAAEDQEQAGELLERAVACDPMDPTLRARLLRLSLLFQSAKEIRSQGLELAELYLSLGVSSNARKVVIRLLKLDSLDQDEGLLSMLAKVEAAAGKAAEAVSIFNRLGNKATKMDREEAALTFFQEALAIHPASKAASKGIAGIETGMRRRRHQRINRMLATAVLSTVGGLFFIYLLHEITGQFMLDRFNSYALEDTVLGRPAASIKQAEVVAASHPFSFSGNAAKRKSQQLARLQLEHLESMVRARRVGEAAVGLVLLKEQAQDYVAPWRWWPMVGEVIEICITRNVTKSERRVVTWALGRLSGEPAMKIEELVIWWSRVGAKRYADANTRKEMPAVAMPR